MEEILASIRRIISEEETSSAAPRAAARSAPDEEGLDTAECEADNRSISDSARVLSGAPQTPPEQEEEEILDLTSELGGLEIVEESVTVEEVVEDASIETLDEAEIVALPAGMPQEQAEAAPAPEPELAPAPEPVAEAAPEPAPEPQPAPAPPPQPMTASEEAASALERAIAALRAGQLPTSISEFAPQPAPPQPAPFYVAPQPEAQQEPGPEPGPEPEPAAAEAASESEPEAELVLTEFETEAVTEEGAAAEVPVEAGARPEWESEPEPWAAVAEPASEPEPPAPRRNGHSGDADAPKTLEDSVKDMLRPMLRQWLDENMPRMVTAALKDELRNNPALFQRD
jgi:cell pole-organizing protein PopZ